MIDSINSFIDNVLSFLAQYSPFTLLMNFINERFSTLSPNYNSLFSRVNFFIPLNVIFSCFTVSISVLVGFFVFKLLYTLIKGFIL